MGDLPGKGHDDERQGKIPARPMRNRLKVLRAERDWSQQDLADRLEVSRQSVNAIETGKYDPSLPLAFRIADLFDMAIEEIFLRGE
ncbi:transcriptional regulator, XRE family [Novosphingobium sp. CF614]|nr:transcriptional regulator, XRE family [Novosphingobium sp. CF614]